MTSLLTRILEKAGLEEDPLAANLLPLLLRPTGLTSAGYPYLERRTFEALRDTTPLLFGSGNRLLATLEALQKEAEELLIDDQKALHLERACRVVRQIVQTAAITAPSDLWLLRHVLGVHKSLGLLDRLLAGEAIHPEFTEIMDGEESRLLDAEQLSIDLEFLLSRGLVEQYDESYRIAGHHRVRELFETITPPGKLEPLPATPLWRSAFQKEPDQDISALLHLRGNLPRGSSPAVQNHWIAGVDEILTGYLLVPLVLGMRANDLTTALQEGSILQAESLLPDHIEIAELAVDILNAAGWVDQGKVTALGARGFARGPGPFGIIQTYVSYMARGEEILKEGRQKVWVRRGENIGASQDANRRTFQLANDSLDRFCEDRGFSFSVFIEHAIGRGEATRQRFQRSGEELIRYFGADLEDPAIDAAEEEQRQGRLPANMVFVRNADIGNPKILIDALKREGLDPQGAVMLVGNGFHEVRGQTDERMVSVFKGYHDAGLLLLFTEENALSIDDLRATAWNTYHAGFKYVHEKSGQCLRPASPQPKPRLGPPLRAAWSECAQKAGYLRLEEYCHRTRTIYPYSREGRHNPSISVNHFFVPASIIEKLP